MEMEKIYSIEYKDTYWGRYYRFHSNYNGAVGAWNSSHRGAEKDGETHQRIIERLHKVKEYV